MTTSVIITLPIACGPTRQVEIRLPVVGNQTCGFDCGETIYPINDFVACCERQAKAMTLIDAESCSVIDTHIGALMASIVSAEQTSAQWPDMHIDCFCYLLRADGFATEEIQKIRPGVTQAIKELYASAIKD